jgi:uncharacterized protein
MITEKTKETRIKNKIFDFIGVLQDAGIYISTAESLDVFSALENIGLTDRDIFRQTLATTLVKDYTDIPIFDKCFTEFFEKKIGQKGFESDMIVKDANNSSVLKDRFNLKEEDMEEIGNQIDKIIDSLFEEFGDKTAREIINILIENPEISSSSGALGMLLFNVRSIFTSANNSGMKGKERGDAEEAEKLLEGIIEDRIRRRVFEKNIGRSVNKREEYLLNKSIYRLTPEEVKEMRELIKRFGQKLKNRVSMRKKRVRHGGIDIKKTLRTSLQYGGIPFRIFHRDKKIDRPQLVVLCDISSSVNHYSRFMLLLTYTLQSLFSKVRSFAFISNMVEITKLFMEMDPERAINSIFSDTTFTYGWGSNYGKCFNEFVKEYSDSLTSKTTVLILGDGRNNNQDPGMEALIRIKERTRNLFWLNPDTRHLWNWSDSIAYKYLPHCTEMKEVNNFLDLTDFIDKLYVK